MKPITNGRSVSDRAAEISPRTRSAAVVPTDVPEPPIIPSAPALDTAPASDPPAALPIGAFMIGNRSPKRSLNDERITARSFARNTESLTA